MEMIKSVQDLPEWFDIEKYQVFESLNELDLIEQITTRLAVFNDAVDMSLDSEVYYSAIQKHPLLDLDACNKLIDAEAGEPVPFESLRSKNKSSGLILPSASSIYPLDLGYAYLLGMRAKHHLGITEDNLTHETVIPNASFFADMDISVSAVAPNQEVGVFIDLSKPDSIILADLRRLLPQFREQMDCKDHAKINYTPSVKKKVLDYQIAAYLDLLVWSTVEQKEIPYRIFAAVLFPDDIKGEEYIRKTVKPLFNKIMTDGFIEDWKAKLNAAS